jgi:ribonucrease Y
MNPMYIVACLAGLIVGFGVAFFILKSAAGGLIARATADAEQLRQTAQRDAESRAKEIELKAKQDQLTAKEAFEKDNEQSRRKLAELESRLGKREDMLDKKDSTLIIKERNLDDLDVRLGKREKSLVDKEQQIDQALDDQKAKLLQITNLTVDQARGMLLKLIEDDSKIEAGEIIKRYEEDAQEQGKEKARQIIIQAIQRIASEQASEHTTSSVTIGDDAMKGRVIGREGRNIRAFEKATGVDVIIDDTPGVVQVSCFDPVRREIARQTLERLILDGRIHPARIEELVVIVGKEMDENLVKLGKEASERAGVINLNKAILPLLGRLAYRTSYGQNVLKHSIEVAYLAQIMADELGLDGGLARRAGLLHDLGKAMDHEQEGGHPQLGSDFLKKFGEVEAVLNAAAGHHGDVAATTPYTPLVMAADAISASRPGARRESVEKYVKRLRDLEALATTFDGVRQAYAIQAGREVRVIVDAQRMDDRATSKMARDISKKIEAELTYPGEIRVTVLREVRSVEYARGVSGNNPRQQQQREQQSREQQPQQRGPGGGVRQDREPRNDGRGDQRNEGRNEGRGDGRNDPRNDSRNQQRQPQEPRQQQERQPQEPRPEPNGRGEPPVSVEPTAG